MTTIRQGSCIGILYKPPIGECQETQCQKYEGGCHCVHNGRLVGAVTKLGNTEIHLSQTLNNLHLANYQGVLFRHWNRPNANSKAIFLEYLFIPSTRIQSVQVIPFKKLYRPVPIPPGNSCSQPKPGQKRKPNIVYPGDCVGIHFRKTDNKWDIKNGKYLFWERYRSRCTWNLKKNNHPDKVWYAHWVVNSKNPHFRSVATSRGPKSGKMEANISIHPITGYHPSEGTAIPVTFLNHTTKNRMVTYK